MEANARDYLPAADKGWKEQIARGSSKSGMGLWILRA